MKHDTTFRNAIAASLDAMQHMIDTSQRDVQTAHEHMTAGEHNAAIGALLPVADALEQALTIHKAVIAMHRFNRQEAP